MRTIIKTVKGTIEFEYTSDSKGVGSQYVKLKGVNRNGQQSFNDELPRSDLKALLKSL